MTSDGIFPSQPSVSAKLIHYLKTNGIFIISVTYLLFRQHTANTPSSGKQPDMVCPSIGTPMIRFEQVSKTYPGGFEALKNVSFQINKGEMIFIAGHSGSGKSTVLKLISGITKPSRGKVHFNNQDLGTLTDNQIGFMRQHIGIVFQDHKILYDRNVLQNVILPLRIIGYQPRKAEERARIAIEKVGLKGRELDDPVTLSGGEQQRLCIARAVVHQPSLLIADEPSANLDRAYALDIMELFKTFHEAGTTVIVAAHDETLMADYGHRILRLSKGRLA